MSSRSVNTKTRYDIELVQVPKNVTYTNSSAPGVEAFGTMADTSKDGVSVHTQIQADARSEVRKSYS